MFLKKNLPLSTFSYNSRTDYSKGYYKRWVKSQDSYCNTNEISGMSLKKTTLLFVVLGGGVILSFLLLVTEMLNGKQALGFINCSRQSQWRETDTWYGIIHKCCPNLGGSHEIRTFCSSPYTKFGQGGRLFKKRTPDIRKSFMDVPYLIALFLLILFPIVYQAIKKATVG